MDGKQATRQTIYCNTKQKSCSIEAKAEKNIIPKELINQDYAGKLQVQFTYSTNSLQIYR